MNPLLLLLLAGGAVVALGGKKKTAPKPDDPSAPEVEDGVEDGVEDETEGYEEEEVDEGAETETGPEYGDIVAKGIRRDKRGGHAWRIKFEEDGYHIQLMMTAFRASPVSEELGTTATLKAAKELIRDTMNERLLAVGYKESDLKEDPVRGPLTPTARLRARS